MTYSRFAPWFDRCLGNWVSHRRYLYYGNRDLPTIQNIRTFFTTDPGENANTYRITWESKILGPDGEPIRKGSTGVMNLTLLGDRLSRDIGYYSKEPTICDLEMLDDDTTVFRTRYNGQSFREEIRFSSPDHRLRQTVGSYDEDESLALVGQYFEVRLP